MWIKKINKVLLFFTVFIFSLIIVGNNSVAHAAYRDTIQAEENLLYYWPMDEASGTSLSALVGGTAININGATPGVSGLVDGTAVSFDGNNDFGQTVATLDLTAHNKIVVEGLFNFDSFNNTDDLAFEFGPNYINGFTFNPNSSAVGNYMLVFLHGDANISGANYIRPTSGAWHHFVAIYDKGQLGTNEVNLYMDGELLTAASRPYNFNNTDNFGNKIFNLMSRNGASLFTAGDVQHLAIYSDLSSSAITSHAQEAGFASFAAGTLSEDTHTDTTATLSWTNATNGNGSVATQLQRSPSGAGTWSNVSGATSSPSTDTGLNASTSYDYRVAYTDQTPETIYSNTTSVTTDATGTLYSVQLSDLWDNGYDNVATPRQSTFTRFVFTTTAPSITVGGTTTIYGSYPSWAQLGVRVDGVNQSPLEFTANGSDSFSVSLGSDGVSKTVEIIGGLQSKPSATVLGTFIDSITYEDGYTFSVSDPTVGDRILFYGDSISVGASATNPESQGYIPLLRNTYDRRVMLEGWGYRSLYEDTNTSVLRDAFVSRLSGYTPNIIWMAIGTNDYGLNKWTATAFGTAYAATLDELHLALPNAKIFCQTPLVRSSETANGNGSTLSDYRNQITTICNDRSWAALVDGTDILTTGNLADGVHPSTAGHAIYASYIDGILESTAPTISNITTSPTSSTATITWTTDEASSTKIDYGLTSSYGTSTTEIDHVSGVTSHSVEITGLSSCTTYHYRVRSKDSALNEAISSDNTFITDGCSSSVSSSSTTTTSTSSAPVCTASAPSSAPWLYAATAQGSDSVMLYFSDAGDPVDSYALEFGTESGKYQWGATNIGGKGDRTYLVQSLQPSKTYYFRVRGGSGCATGEWSNEISVTTKSSVSFRQFETKDLIIEPVITTKDSSKETKNDDEIDSGGSDGFEDSDQSDSETTTPESYKVNIKVKNDKDNPVVGAKVTMHSKVQETTTDENGIARFENVEPGEHRVLVAYDGYEGEQSLQLTGDNEEFNLSITLKKQNVLTSPIVLAIIGGFSLIVVVLVILLVRKSGKV